MRSFVTKLCWRSKAEVFGAKKDNRFFRKKINLRTSHTAVNTI